MNRPVQGLQQESEFVHLLAFVSGHRSASKVIKPAHPSKPEKAQINIKEGDHLCRKMRVETS
jgi:hypothetical protein